MNLTASSEAADIVRKWLENLPRDPLTERLAEALRELEADVERMKAALTVIANGPGLSSNTSEYRLRIAQGIARNALVVRTTLHADKEIKG